MRLRWLVLLALAGLMLAGGLYYLTPPNIADSRSADEICFDREEAVSKLVLACTALIDSGRFSGQDLASIYFERAMAFQSWGKIDRAISDFQESDRICPSAADHDFLGGIYEERGELDRALAEYSEMVRLEPEQPSGYQRRADLRMKQGEYKKAIPDWTEAIRFEHPVTVVYEYFRRAQAYSFLGREADALADLNKAIETDPYASGAYNDRAKIYEARGEREKAIDDFRKALAAQPYDATATEGLKRLGVKP
ncbi:MAG TPA: tetratricopeptide repeat protein [Xanthobacteraceae bacterium]|nr:tetratricopeptide repeat protein [Xanthobacteraceae bacterium]